MIYTRLNHSRQRYDLSDNARRFNGRTIPVLSRVELTFKTKRAVCFHHLRDSGWYLSRVKHKPTENLTRDELESATNWKLVDGLEKDFRAQMQSTNTAMALKSSSSPLLICPQFSLHMISCALYSSAYLVYSSPFPWTSRYHQSVGRRPPLQWLQTTWIVQNLWINIFYINIFLKYLLPWKHDAGYLFQI